MRRMGMVLFGLLALLGSAHAADLRLQVVGDLVIDPQGHVSDYVVKTIVTPEVKAVLDRSVRGWTFEPSVRDGKAVYVRSRLHLDLVALKSDAGYQLRVEQIRFTGARDTRSMLPPRYPKEAARAGIGGDVLVAVRVNGEGTVIDAVPVQTSLPYINVSERDVARWGRFFEKSAVTAAKAWVFQPADLRVEDAETTIIVPVSYRMGDAPLATGEGWRRDSVTPAQRIPWLNESQQQFDPTGLKEGESLAVGQQPKLTTHVVGATL